MGRFEHIPNDIHIQGDTAYMVLTNRAGFPVAVTMIDADDVPLIRAHPYRWSADWNESTHSYYVAGVERRDDGTYAFLSLHRFLIQPPRDLEVDHINRNTLDNRRTNLRPCTHLENVLNSRPKKTGHIKATRPKTHRPWYVWFDRGRWKGYVVGQDKRHRIGSHATREDAVRRAELILGELSEADSA